MSAANPETISSVVLAVLAVVGAGQKMRRDWQKAAKARLDDAIEKERARRELADTKTELAEARAEIRELKKGPGND